MTSRQITGGGGGGGGASSSVSIHDGVDSNIKASVLDLAGSDPLTVAIVDGSGAQVTSFGGTGGTSMTDDAAFTPGTTPITPVGGTYRSVRDAVDDNDGGALAINPKRGLYVTIETPASDSAMDDTLNTVNVSIPAGAVASGAILSGAVASGAISSGAIASGAVASGAVASGAFASGSISSGAIAAGAIAAGATSIAENEDVASANADRGVKILFKRLDTPANSSDTDGDYEQPQMSAGRVWVSAAVTAVSGNVTVVQGTATNLKAQAENYQGGSAVGAANPLEVSLANTAANGTAVKVNVASGGIASGAVASGAIASGAVASGAFASGSIASGAIAAGAIAAGATSIAENEDVASADGDRGVKILFKRLDTPANASGTDGDYEQPQMSAGRVWVSAAIPSGGVASGAVASGAVASGAIASGAVASGAFASGSIASGAIAAGAIAAGATSIAENEDVASADGDRGVKVLYKRKDSPADASGTDGDYEQPQMSGGRIWTNTTLGASTAGTGASTMNATSSDGATALTNSAQAIKASAGKLMGYYIYNPNATAQFVQFYNTAAASVTVGTTNPLFMLTIPATSAANLFTETGIAFSNAGWSWAATSTAGGNGAPSSALDAVAWYI